MKKTWYFLLFSFFVNSIFAQVGTLQFVSHSQSKELMASGDIGAAKYVDDPSGFYQNPAMLGQRAFTKSVAFSLMPTKVAYRGFADSKFSNYSAVAGHSFNLFNTQFAVGFGYIHHKLEWEDGFCFRIGDNPYHEYGGYESFDCYGLSLATDLKYLKLSLGISYKDIVRKRISHISSAITTVTSETDNAGCLDYGVMAYSELRNILFPNLKFDVSRNSDLVPLANITLGYSALNVGPRIRYTDSNDSDPLPRMEKLGYTFDFGFDYETEGLKINFITYSFSAEVENLLVKYVPSEATIGEHPIMKPTYQNMLSDIKIWDNLICLNSSSSVFVRKAHSVTLFDSFIVTSGRYTEYYNNAIRKTSGFGFTTNGLFKLLDKYVDNNMVNFITKHMEVKYFSADYEVYKSINTKPSGITVSFKNLELGL